MTKTTENHKEATYITYENIDHVGIINYTEENMEMVNNTYQERELILACELPSIIKGMTESETEYIININSKTTNK